LTAAGGHWPARARQAAIALSREELFPVMSGIRLLGDIRQVFAGRDNLASAAPYEPSSGT